MEARTITVDRLRVRVLEAAPETERDDPVLLPYLDRAAASVA